MEILNREGQEVQDCARRPAVATQRWCGRTEWIPDGPRRNERGRPGITYYGCIQVISMTAIMMTAQTTA
jgi:hypothetical protein